MTAVLAQRQLALGAAALLGVVASLAISDTRSSSKPERTLPQPVPAAGGGWYRALAGVGAGPGEGRRSACGLVLTAASLGAMHAVLPCGAKIYMSFGGKEVLTQVIDRGPIGPGREFNLTPGLAAELGLHGVQPIRWAFARG